MLCYRTLCYRSLCYRTKTFLLTCCIAIWYHIFYDISAYVMVPGRWAASGTGSSWGARRSGLATEPKYWGLQSESYYPSFHIMIAVVVKFRTRQLRISWQTFHPESAGGSPDRLGVTDCSLRLTQGPLSWEPSSCQALRKGELVHVTARALIIEIQLYTAPLRKI